MKKILAIAMALVMMLGCVVAFSSCNESATPAGDGNTPAKEKLVCGVTIFENMNEKDANGNWIGFESEFAMAVAEILGMEVEFQEIDWGQKYNELNSGAIDCIWNGFTANASEKDGMKRSDLVDFSYGYMRNRQCIVVKTDRLAEFTSEASLAGKSACVEGGSAGETYASGVGASEVLPATSQINAFPEVKSGAVDFIVVDYLLAKNVCGQGDYANLSIVDAIELESEIYAIGFKKGSDLTAKVNAAIKQLEENGKLMEIAEKYGFAPVLEVRETIE